MEEVLNHLRAMKDTSLRGTSWYIIGTYSCHCPEISGLPFQPIPSLSLF